jgi:hypothetical protein
VVLALLSSTIDGVPKGSRSAARWVAWKPPTSFTAQASRARLEPAGRVSNPR